MSDAPSHLQDAADLVKMLNQARERLAELEAERDALKQKVAHLDKLADLYPISLGNACEDRDKLKHSDRALRKALEEIAATENEPVSNAIGPLYGAGINAGARHCARIAREALKPQPTPQTLEQSLPDGERIAELEAERAEHDASFDLRWKADMRAIKRWQEATGRTLVWPDHADLCVWLLERIAELEASVRNQQGDNICWFDLATMQIPPQGDFLESCRRYHAQIAQTNGVLEGSRTIAQLEARVAELEAERDALNRELDEQLKILKKLLAVHEDSEAENAALKEKVGTLESKMERALIAVAHFTHSYNQDLETIAGLRQEIAGLHQEVGMLSGNPEAVHQGALAALSAIKQMTEMKAESAALRTALMKLRGAVDGIGLDYPYLSECKAEAIETLSRIPEVKP